MPQLTGIITITATLEVLTGLRIGAGDAEMQIGGVDNTVIKHPHTKEPYLPGSSLKGKLRSLLEWRSGAVKDKPLGYQDYASASDGQRQAVKQILQLFGVGGGELRDQQTFAAELGPSRLSFWDCMLAPEWVAAQRENNLPLTEVKSENSINRISGEAINPRQTERIPAGARFQFRLSMKKLDSDNDDLLQTVLQGMKLIELDSLGGSGSRGYGKVRFTQLQVDQQTRLNGTLDDIQPFGQK